MHSIWGVRKLEVKDGAEYSSPFPVAGFFATEQGAIDTISGLGTIPGMTFTPDEILVFDSLEERQDYIRNI